MRTVDRTPKPCLHKVANHIHGTRACYVLDKCRCLPCSKANSVAQATRVRAKLYGRYDKYVDAEPVRAHVRALTDSGIGLKQIVKVGGASQGTLWKLMYGKKKPDGSQTPSRRVLRTTAERLYAIAPEPQHLADGARIEAHGTRRRLQGLVAIGYSQSYLADRLGWGAANFGNMLHHRGHVTVATARAVEALYDELAMTPRVGTDQRTRISISRARNYAAYMMWLPPLAWDDDDIDNPFATPAEMVADGRRDVVEDFDWLVDNGESLEQAAERLGVALASIERTRERRAA